MEYPSFHYPNGTQSYPSHEVVWKYLDSYAEHFHIKENIKYHHLVEKVRSIPNDKWELTIRDLPNNQSIVRTYDAVFVCTGISSSPLIPQIKGVKKYEGKIMHSRDYRKPEIFEGKHLYYICDYL